MQRPARWIGPVAAENLADGEAQISAAHRMLYNAMMPGICGEQLAAEVAPGLVLAPGGRLDSTVSMRVRHLLARADVGSEA